MGLEDGERATQGRDGAVVVPEEGGFTVAKDDGRDALVIGLYHMEHLLARHRVVVALFKLVQCLSLL